MAKDFPGWCSRVLRVCRSDFGPLAKLAAIPAALAAAYLSAMYLVQLSPEEIQARVAAASAAAGHQISADEAVGMILARMLPIMVVFGLLMILVMPLVQGAGLFTVVRRANREFAPMDSAVRFALPRMARLVGWMLVVGLLTAAVAMLAMLPGYWAESRQLFTAGKVLGTVFVVVVGGSVFSALLGVVLVEGKGLRRCRELLHGRLLATGVRMAVAAAIYAAYSQVSQWLIAGMVALLGPGLVPSLLAAALTIPALVFQIVVPVVTYAELRRHEDNSLGTGGLAVEMVARRWPGSVGAVSFDGPTATAISVAPRRRWRGFRWATPILVVALVLGAGSPGAFDATVTSSVVPATAVSPVPMGPDDTGGDAGSGDSAGSEPAVSGSSDVGSNDSSSGSGDSPPKVESKPDSNAGGDDGENAGGESPPAVSDGPDTARPEANTGGETGPTPEQPQGEVSAPGASQRDPKAANGVDAAAPPPGDPPATGTAVGAVAGSNPPTDQASPGVAGSAPVRPGTDPNNLGVAGGPAPPVGRTDPGQTAAAAQANMACPTPAACNPNMEDAADSAEAGLPPRPTNREIAHGLLDIAGAFPVAGELFDAANSGIYMGEGKYLDAGISAGSALLPVIGDAVFKRSRLLGKSTQVVEDARVAEVARMTPAQRAGLEKRAKGMDLGDEDYGKTIGEGIPVRQTPNTPDAGRAGRDTLAQGDAAVPPSGPARANTSPGEPPGPAQTLDPSKPRTNLAPVGDFADEGLAFEHYSKHVKGTILKPNGKAKAADPDVNPDMPEYKSFSEYKTAARGFMGGGKQDGVLEGIRPDGDLVRFDPKTERFGIRSPQGVIKTFFRPINGDDKTDKTYAMKYFRKQFE